MVRSIPIEVYLGFKLEYLSTLFILALSVPFTYAVAHCLHCIYKWLLDRS